MPGISEEWGDASIVTPSGSFIFFLTLRGKDGVSYETTAKTGEYRLIGSGVRAENLDLRAYFDNESGAYDFVSGKHTVTAIKRVGKYYAEYKKNLEYMIEGSFSGIFKHAKTGKTVDVKEGKYWTKIYWNSGA
jgi:hypothetical protein